MCLARVPVFALLGWLLHFAVLSPASHAAEDVWPEGDVIANKSQSPNGRYAVLIPTWENVDTSGDIDEEKIHDKLVDLKTHKPLCVIRGISYYRGRTHHGLDVQWAPDSTWCVVTEYFRTGFSAITLVEIAGTKCAQSDLGEELQKAMDAVVSRQSHKSETESFGEASFRQGPGRTILVHGTADTNPKMSEERPTYYARFEGIFDLATHKWTHSGTAGFKLSTSLDDGHEPTEGTDEEKLQWFDNSLNDVYQATRTVLPAKRFAKVKKEQLDWLKQLEAQKTAADKIKLMRPRIAQLRDLLW